MGYRRLETLTAIAGAGYWVWFHCPCGHEAKENPMVIVERLAGRGADLRLRLLHRSMKCGKCGGKDFTAEHCEGTAIWS